MSVRQPSRDEVPLVKPAGGVPAAAPEAEGALVVALRWPVRIVVLVLVVPARMAWDALVVCGRALRRTVWEPFVKGLAWLGRALFVWPWVGLWRYVLVPVGRGLGWLGHVVIVIPAAALYRYVLTPVGRVLAVLGREIADAVVVCGQLAGRISRAVFGFLGRGLRLLLVDPAVWVWRHVLAPVGRWLRDHVWRPVADGARGVGRTVRGTVASARATAREVWADVRRALFRGPRRAAPEPGAAPAPRPATPPGEASASRSEPVPLRKSAGR